MSNTKEANPSPLLLWNIKIAWFDFLVLLGLLDPEFFILLECYSPYLFTDFSGQPIIPILQVQALPLNMGLIDCPRNVGN